MDKLGDIGTISEKYKELDHEVRRLFKNEYDTYIQEKTEFYNNPLHWSNNKRRIHGLNSLRGHVNKFRSKEFPSFRLSYNLFNFIEDVTDKILEDEFSKYILKYFVGINDITLGDKNFVWNYKQEEV